MRIIKTTATHLLVLFLWVLSFKTFGQEKLKSEGIWFQFLPSYQWNDRWLIGNEFHYRRIEQGKSAQQLLIRPFLRYGLPGGNAALAAGYTYIENYPYHNPIENFTHTEHNIWEQIEVFQDVSILQFALRFRVEHRYVSLYENYPQSENKTGSTYATRYRTRLRFDLPLGKLKSEWKSRLFVYNELWMSFNDYNSNQGFNQNWMGFGYRKGIGSAQLELAYQRQALPTGQKIELNDLILLNVFLNITKPNEN